MNDEQFIQWLMFVTDQVSSLRSARAAPTNAGPRYNVQDTTTIEQEGFSRWMGWRGEAEQEREMSWSTADLKEERLERSYRKVWRENQDLKSLLRFIREEISKRDVGP